VIAVTAMAMEGDRERVMASGCDGYFSKPISVHEFRQSVAELIGGAVVPQPHEKGSVS
jgi:two-component system, cell cycle response regulator DivK